MNYSRNIDLQLELASKSCFLLGPRGTGKSFWIKQTLIHQAQIFNLLDSDVYQRFLRRPRLLGDEIKTNQRYVVIDEIQKLPKLLDEVHRLIEEKNIHFLLTGSSARKLKKEGINLLGGRARMLSFFPLTSFEISDFDLIKYCNVGGLPSIYQSDDPQTDLKNYVYLYLKEEIQNEALVRKMDHFSQFLDAFGLTSGKELNYQTIASESGVPVRTLSQYVEVLKDTLLVYELLPFQKTKNRKAVSKSKLYLFDVGVANYMAGRRQLDLKTESFGTAFEHFVLQEIRCCLARIKSDDQMHYWRTYQGDEVDCIIGHKYALEIKATEQVQPKHLKGLKMLRAEGLVKNYFLISNDPIEKTMDGIQCYPWKTFLEKMYSGTLSTGVAS